MRAQGIENMFNFTFQKTSSEIVTSVNAKVVKIKAKIEERIVRIQKMREEHGITDVVYADILQQVRNQAQKAEAAMYNSTVKMGNGEGQEVTVTVGAGVINFLMTEQDFIVVEREQITKLELIARNLRPVNTSIASIGIVPSDSHVLTFAELTYLGF